MGGAADRADGLGRREREQRAQPFAARAHAVPHGVGDERGAGGRRRKQPFEGVLDRGAALVNPAVEWQSGLGHVLAHRAVRPRGSSARVGAEGRGRRLQLAALVEDLDAALHLLELPVAEARQRHATLVQAERRFEREVAFLELLDDGLELGDRALEIVGRGLCAHVTSAERLGG